MNGLFAFEGVGVVGGLGLGLVWFCGPGVLRVVGWWCGSGREPCVASRPGRLSGKRTVERDISKESIQQAEIAFSKAEKRPETI